MSSDVAGLRAGSDGSPPLQLTFTPVDRCPACDARPSSAWLAAHDLLHGVPGTFRYRRCRRCRTVFQAPRVADDSLTACYPEGYFTHEAGEPGSAGAAPAAPGTLAPGSAPSGVRSAVRGLVLGSLRGARGRPRWAVAAGRALAAVPAVRNRAAFGMMTELVPSGLGGRCLEIGPGTGADLARLRALGWAVVEGLDLDPEAARRAAARSGCTVHVGHLHTFVATRRYDVIYASHALEHLPAVRTTLRRLGALLHTSGRLVLIVPNPGSLTTRLDRRHAVTVDAPRHLVLPPLRALRRALDDSGFTVDVARTSARRTAHYRAIARARRRGTTGTRAWQEPPVASDRIVAGAARLLCALRLPVGEELVVVARRVG
jgi:SAM-dependent methyltransferase